MSLNTIILGPAPLHMPRTKHLEETFTCLRKERFKTNQWASEGNEEVAGALVVVAAVVGMSVSLLLELFQKVTALQSLATVAVDGSTRGTTYDNSAHDVCGTSLGYVPGRIRPNQQPAKASNPNVLAKTTKPKHSKLFALNPTRPESEIPIPHPEQAQSNPSLNSLVLSREWGTGSQ